MSSHRKPSLNIRVCIPAWLPEFGRALSWLRDDGYTAPVRDDGHTDRSLRDVDVAEFIICCEYPEQFVEEALALGSDKAQERAPDHARSYAASRVRVALERHNIT